MSNAKFAVDTKVPVDRTKAEIEKLISKYGASQFYSAWDSDSKTAIIGFAVRRTEKAVPTCVRIRAAIDTRTAQKERTSWRGLWLCIKGKLESVSTGIETFEQAFFANILMPDNRTVYEHAAPLVLKTYETGKAVPLLPEFK